MTEPSLFSEAVKQVPALAVLCYVVWMFLGKLTVFTTALHELQKEQNTVVAQLQKEHLDARNLSREAIRDNTQAMRENTVAMSHLVETVDRIKERKGSL